MRMSWFNATSLTLGFAFSFPFSLGLALRFKLALAFSLSFSFRGCARFFFLAAGRFNHRGFVDGDRLHGIGVARLHVVNWPLKTHADRKQAK